MIGGIGYLILVIGRTATRAAIPALLVMLSVYFLRSKGAHRLAIVAFTLIGGTLAVFALPDSAVERLATVLEAFNPPAETQFYQGLTEAQASSLERHEIMRDAIETALYHPFVGIGAGLFVQYRYDKMLRPDGSHKPYLPAHNTYLEIASESGIPGLILYLVFLWTVYASIRKTLKLTAGRANPQADLLWSIALSNEAALAYFATCAAFMTCDKHPHQFVLAGFALAMYQMASSLQMEAPVTATLAMPHGGTARFGRQGSSPALAR
jgi:O-antigen ligase